MNASHFQSPSYVPIGAEGKRRQEEWDEYQQQPRVQRTSMSDIPEDSSHNSAAKSRKRADSHQPTATPPWARRSVDASHVEYHQSSITCAHSRSLHSHEKPRRLSSADYGRTGDKLSPQLSPSNPYGEVRRLSGNFNAPTHVELERTREHRKSLTSVEKLRSKVKGWVRA